MSDYLLGNVVRNYRQENHLSLRAFGEMCGISHTTIDCIEKGYDPRTGKHVNITNTTFSKLADVLKIPVSTLVDLSVGIDDLHRVAGGWMTTSAMASVLAKGSKNDVSQSDDSKKTPAPVSEDGLDKQDKHLTEGSETAKKFLPERLREAMGPMNCDEFAQKFDGNAKIISLYLSGQRRPDKVTLHLMAIYLGVNPDWLYGLDAPKYKKSILSNEDGLNPELVALIKLIPDDRMPEVERYLRFQAEQGEKS